VVRRLLTDSDALVFNLDKCGYASDLTSIEALPQAAERHTLLRVDLTDAEATAAAVRQADPDLVLHLGGCCTNNQRATAVTALPWLRSAAIPASAL
jgi:dTDP-D-glucose 4,6-dehydratase